MSTLLCGAVTWAERTSTFRFTFTFTGDGSLLRPEPVVADAARDFERHPERHGVSHEIQDQCAGFIHDCFRYLEHELVVDLQQHACWAAALFERAVDVDH